MSRSENRANIRKNQKLSKEIKKLTPNQLKLLDNLSQFKADKIIDIYQVLVDKAVFKAMRENHVGEDRANTIMEEANEWMQEEIKKQ